MESLELGGGVAKQLHGLARSKDNPVSTYLDQCVLMVV